MEAGVGSFPKNTAAVLQVQEKRTSEEEGEEEEGVELGGLCKVVACLRREARDELEERDARRLPLCVHSTQVTRIQVLRPRRDGNEAVWE